MLDHYKEYGFLATLNIVWPMNMFGLIAFLCILKLPFHSQLTYFFKKGICWLWKEKKQKKTLVYLLLNCPHKYVKSIMT